MWIITVGNRLFTESKCQGTDRYYCARTSWPAGRSPYRAHVHTHTHTLHAHAHGRRGCGLAEPSHAFSEEAAEPSHAFSEEAAACFRGRSKFMPVPHALYTCYLHGVKTTGERLRVFFGQHLWLSSKAGKEAGIY